MEAMQVNSKAKIFLDREIHVYGATGAEGSAVIRWLVSIGHANIVAHDFCENFDAVRSEWRRVNETATEEDETEYAGLFSHASIQWRLGSEYPTLPGDDAMLFVTQSWFRYENNSFLRKFFSKNLEVLPEYIERIWTITRLYFHLFPGKIIGVTGSDGKTTTTRMIGSIMRAYAEKTGVSCLEMGNDRTHTQSIAAVAAASERDFLVLEISDRQLSFNFDLRPDVAVVTNVTPNKHMDDYGGFDAYVDKKANLVRHQNKNGVAILNADNNACESKIISIGSGARQWVSVTKLPELGMWCDGKEIFSVIDGKKESVMQISDLQVFGKHNWVNAMQALSAAHAAGVPLEFAAEALREFKGVPHRLQPIRTWKRILFVEDSSGGNPANIPITIETFHDRPLVIILGGYRAQLTLEEVQPIITALNSHHSVTALLLIGQVAPKLHELLQKHVTNLPLVFIAETLQGSIGWVADHAEEITRHGSAVVCMTPAFESFDQYRDYRARAAHFIDLVQSLS